jgi:hypothetical protein
VICELYMCSMQNVKGPSKSFSKHEAKHISDHKVCTVLLLPCSPLRHELNLKAAGQPYFLNINLAALAG